MLSLLETESSNFGEYVVTPQVPKTRKWHAINTYFRMQLRCGINTSFVMDMAHTEGSTPVHYGEDFNKHESKHANIALPRFASRSQS